MILASLRISGCCDEIQWVYDWRYLLIVPFRHLSHMLSHSVQLHARLFGSMRLLLHAYLVGSIFV